MSSLTTRTTTARTSSGTAVSTGGSARTSSTGDDEYVTFCEGVRVLSSIDLSQYKRGQMERRIRSFARRKGHESLADYLVVLKAAKNELDDFLDRMTINVSQLWRNPEQWDVLGRVILPELASTGRPVAAWSAGSSYGAESYTVAALCREHIPTTRATIKGTDIDKRMVERARKGHFSAEDARTAPPALLAKYFDREGDGYQAKRELVSMCSFEVGDLLRMAVPAGRLDLVLCRNTVIYFNDEVRNALHARLAQALRPGGYLIIGSTERVQDPREMDLTPTHPFVYRKSDT